MRGFTYMKKKNEEIGRVCALCEHAIIKSATLDEKTPPLLFSLTCDVFDEDTVKISCPYHKNITPDFSCRRFLFDPLKYHPKKAPAVSKLDEESLLLD